MLLKGGVNKMNTVLKKLVDVTLSKRTIEAEDLQGYKTKKDQVAICDCDGDGECCSE
jgi:hypothetical protein